MDEGLQQPASGAGAAAGGGDGEGRELEAVTIETARPLSHSFLWDLQAQYYDRSGVEAWSSGDVPFTLTSAPRVAAVFAQLLTAFLEDCRAGRMGPYDESEPTYVLELGAGAGRLAYYVLQALDPELIAPARVVYVLTDRVEANLQFWTSHPKLAELIDAGRADVARYEAGSRDGLLLEHSGVRLEPGRIANPLAATACYLFDVLPQDLYCAAAGGLEEELVEVLGEADYLEAPPADLLDHMYIAAHHVPARPERYGARVGRVLTEVAGERAGNGERFLFPAPAIETIDGLRALAGDRLLFVIGEREELQLLPGVAGTPPSLAPTAPPAEQVAAEPPDTGPAEDPGSEPPVATLTYYHPSMFCGMGFHGGSISLPVDMSVIARATRLDGADMLRSPVPSAGLTIAAVVAGEEPRASALRERYAAAVVDLPPDDLLLAVRTALSREDLPLEYLLACLRVTRYDPIALALVSEKLAAALPPADEHRAELVRVLERISELDFSITNQGDVPYAVATLLGRAAEFERAVDHFARARARYGPRPHTLYGEAMCQFGLDRVEEGVAALEACLALDPSFVPARQLLDRVLAGDLTPPSGPMPARR